MKLKIVSDGTPGGTSVMDAESGSIIEGVTSVSWKISLDTQLAQAEITLLAPAVEVVGAEPYQPAAECTSPHIHCWHDTGRLPSIHPPSRDFVCCLCGTVRNVPEEMTLHGPHHPTLAAMVNK